MCSDKNIIFSYSTGSEGHPCSLAPPYPDITCRDLTVVLVRDLLCPAKRSEAGTGQPDNQSHTTYFVGDFLFVARFLPGF